MLTYDKLYERHTSIYEIFPYILMQIKISNNLRKERTIKNEYQLVHLSLKVTYILQLREQGLWL